MFDFGFPELLLVLVVALIAVGPKDIPAFMFKAGRLFRRGKLLMHRANNAVSDVMHELEVDEYRRTMKEDILDFGSIDKDTQMTPLKNTKKSEEETKGGDDD